ncbi:MAG: hypothetical protein F6K42_31555 [Leptolyngbya sp. SIO1D8]|nr:hypothetical protein [Leptolyngbya sp. SIO1D8]
MEKTAKGRMTQAFAEVLGVYNDTALLINSSHVAKDKYEGISDPNFRLSITQGIPPQYQLPDLEIEFMFNSDELVEQYGKRLIEVLCKNYLVTIVSVFDAALEDIYEMLLTLQNKQLTNERINRLVRSAWASNQNGRSNLRSFFIDELCLKSPEGNDSTLDMVFDRYEEIREIRHAVVHNGGLLSQKNKSRLKELSERLPPELRQRALISLDNVGFIYDGKVELDIADLCILRAWFYKIVSYFSKVLESVEDKLQNSL